MGFSGNGVELTTIEHKKWKIVDVWIEERYEESDAFFFELQNTTAKGIGFVITVECESNKKLGSDILLTPEAIETMESQDYYNPDDGIGVLYFGPDNIPDYLEPHGGGDDAMFKPWWYARYLYNDFVIPFLNHRKP